MQASKLTPLCAALCCASALGVAVPARADQISDLQAEVQKLSAEVQQLKSAQDKTAQQTAATQKLVAESGVASSAPLANATPLTFGSRQRWVQLYGDIDLYANDQRSSSGTNLTAVEDGGILRSRLGLKGHDVVASGYAVNFDMEQSLDFTNGSQPGAGRLFDRQAWAGLSTPVGEFRVGRQESIAFFHGGMMDFTSRTLGSVVNAFGVPVRFDGDFSYISPKLDGVQFQAHYSLNGAQSTTATNGAVYQLGVDYAGGPVALGYSGLWAKPPSGATYSTKAEYQNLYADYNYGRGKVYLAYVRSNAANGVLSGIGGVYPGGVPMTGNVAAVNTYYDVYQASADYDLTAHWRVGALYGVIRDSSNAGGGARGWATGTYYTGLKNTTLYAVLDELSNDPAASFDESGSAPLTKHLSSADLTGKRITGLQLGFMYKF
jgi:predicted porin